MAPLSSSVSTLRTTNFNSTPRELHHLKTPTRPCQLPPPPSPLCSLSFSTTTKTTPFSAHQSTLFTHKSLTSLGSSHLTPSPTHIHRNPATGYAAALLDIAQCNGSVDSVQHDVQKFARLLRNSQIQALLNDPSLGYKEKGEAVKELARKGKFNKHLVSLLKLLVEKNKLEMVSEVLDEFERIYDGLIDTKLVWISSEKMIGEDRLFKIAKRIQEISGAAKVKVKNLVADKLPKRSNFSFMERDILRHFEPYGKVHHVRIRRNFAFVQFSTQEEATKALEATQRRVVSVEYALRDDDERDDRNDSPRRGGGFGRSGDSPYARSPSPAYRRRPSPDYGRARSPVYNRYNGPAYDRNRSPIWYCF
ncbi:hypothetical protein V6N13_128435 [Hibiscus sabdariffa]|uniref:RRM domain-containing protein n=1 Tax=Hibiscus sabdariffa TaxID=183260 RepID=A0ABR2P0T8_9ROSI